MLVSSIFVYQQQLLVPLPLSQCTPDGRVKPFYSIMSLAHLVSTLVQELPGGKLVSVAPNNKLGQKLSTLVVHMPVMLLPSSSSASDTSANSSLTT